jgi:hypothetical protein
MRSIATTADSQTILSSALFRKSARTRGGIPTVKNLNCMSANSFTDKYSPQRPSQAWERASSPIVRFITDTDRIARTYESTPESSLYYADLARSTP